MSGLPETTSRTGLLVGLAFGVPVMAYGVGGALTDADDTHPAELARWIVGLAIVNDFLLIPLALGLGLIVKRIASEQAWPAVRTGLLCSATLCAVAWPILRGYGEDPTIPSLFPRDYAAGLAGALGAIWLGVGLWVIGSRLRRRLTKAR